MIMRLRFWLRPTSTRILRLRNRIAPRTAGHVDNGVGFGRLRLGRNDDHRQLNFAFFGVAALFRDRQRSASCVEARQRLRLVSGTRTAFEGNRASGAGRAAGETCTAGRTAGRHKESEDTRFRHSSRNRHRNCSPREPYYLELSRPQFSAVCYGCITFHLDQDMVWIIQASIPPDKTQKNVSSEKLVDRLRDECLNETLFTSLLHPAHAVV